MILLFGLWTIEPEAIAQRKLQEIANNSQQAMQLRAFQEMANNSPQTKQAAQLWAMADDPSTQQRPIQKKENNTGLPDNLKTGMEKPVGMSLDDVKMHRNSDKSAQLQTHVYAHGTNIHLGTGQGKHLLHEAWHVVQQKQGRVKPTKQLKAININNDTLLEKEANIMDEKALQKKALSTQAKVSNIGISIIQRKVALTDEQIQQLQLRYPGITLEEINSTNTIDVTNLDALEKKIGVTHKGKGKKNWGKVEALEDRTQSQNTEPGILSRNYNYLSGALSYGLGTITDTLSKPIKLAIERRTGLNIQTLNISFNVLGSYGSIQVNKIVIGPSIVNRGGYTITIPGAEINRLHIFLGTKGILSILSDLKNGDFRSLTELAGEINLESLSAKDVQIKLQEQNTEGEQPLQSSLKKLFFSISINDMKVIAGDNLFAVVFGYIGNKIKNRNNKQNIKSFIQQLEENAQAALNLGRFSLNIESMEFVNKKGQTMALPSKLEANDITAAGTYYEGTPKARASIGGIKANGIFRNVSNDEVLADVQSVSAENISGQIYGSEAQIQTGKMQAINAKAFTEKGHIEAKNAELAKLSFSGQKVHKGAYANIATGKLTANGISAREDSSGDTASIGTLQVPAVITNALVPDTKPGATKPEFANIAGQARIPSIIANEIQASKDGNTATVKQIAVNCLRADAMGGRAQAGFDQLEIGDVSAHVESGKKLSQVDAETTASLDLDKARFNGAGVVNSGQETNVTVNGLDALGLRSHLQTRDTHLENPKKPSAKTIPKSRNFDLILEEAGVRPASATLGNLNTGKPELRDTHVGGTYINNAKLISNVLNESIATVHSIDLNLTPEGSGKGIANITVAGSLAHAVDEIPGILSSLISSQTELSFKVNKGALDLASVRIQNKRRDKNKSKFKPDKTFVNFLAELLNRNLRKIGSVGGIRLIRKISTRKGGLFTNYCII